MIIQIIVFSRDFVDIDITELCYNSQISINDCFSIYLCVCSFNNPFFKDFSSLERILRHLTDCLTFGSEILRKTLRYCTCLIKDDKINFERIFKACRNRKI